MLTSNRTISVEPFQAFFFSPKTRFCALLAAALWLLVATYFGLPVSTTHTIVSGIVGFSLVELGGSSIHTSQIIKILISWIISPFLGAAFGFAMFFFINYSILRKPTPFFYSIRLLPLICAFTLAVLALFVIIKNPSKDVQDAIPWWGELLLFFAIFFLCYGLVYFLVLPYLLKRVFANSGVVDVNEGKTVSSSPHLLFVSFLVNLSCYSFELFCPIQFLFLPVFFLEPIISLKY